MQTTGSIGAVWESKYVKDAFMVTIDILRTKFIAVPNPNKWATGEGKRAPSHLLYVYKAYTGSVALDPTHSDSPVDTTIQVQVYKTEDKDRSLDEKAHEASGSVEHYGISLERLDIRNRRYEVKTEIFRLETSGEAKTS